MSGAGSSINRSSAVFALSSSLMQGAPAFYHFGGNNHLIVRGYVSLRALRPEPCLSAVDSAFRQFGFPHFHPLSHLTRFVSRRSSAPFRYKTAFVACVCVCMRSCEFFHSRLDTLSCIRLLLILEQESDKSPKTKSIGRITTKANNAQLCGYREHTHH